MNGFYKRNNGSNALIEVIGTHESGDHLCVWAFDNYEPFRYHPYKFKNEFVKVSQEYVDSIERHSCPDRLISTNLNSDRWDVLFEGYRKCSYCGSIHPDDLIEMLKKHGHKIIERTTKPYKWYIHVKNKTVKYYRWHDQQNDFVTKYNEIIKEKLNEKEI